MAEWRPLGQTAEEADELHEGIPPWMKDSIWRWIAFLVTEPRSHTPGRRFRVEVIEGFDRVTREPFPIVPRLPPGSGVPGLMSAMDPFQVLQFVDYLLYVAPNSGTARELDEILHESGSAWKVGNREGFPGLERRVPEGVQEAADQAMRTHGNAGARLSEAWHAVYGIAPNPGHAYKMAVVAVEDAAIPRVVPKQSGATLGHVIGQLRNDGDWALGLTREDPDAPTAQTVLGMCRALWSGHHDRHGGVPEAPVSVSQEEAEAAVHMAVFLVQGFASGLIARR